jgi:general secretion pathway protein D
VLIAEVRRDRSLSFGLDVTLGETTIKGAEPTTISGTNSGLGLGDFALKVMGFKQYDVQATLRAAASRGDAKIMSRPILVAANNEDAEILVGSQRPFVQVSRSLPTSDATRDQVVQYKDVGTRLAVRPTVSADGYVMLQVTQEVNQATTETQFDAPIISTRSVQTRLLIKDGQTIVLGGLTDRQREVHQTGIPFLSSIPLIGGFFGNATRTAVETELFIFLTPRVLKTDDDATKMTVPLQDRANRSAP